MIKEVLRKRIIEYLSVLVIAITVTILINLSGIFNFIDTIIFALLIFSILISITNHILLEKRIDELIYQLTNQLVKGNPNAVFELSDQNQAITGIIKNAESDILFVGTSFVGFLSLESHVIIKSLERGLKVKILLIAPSVASSQNDIQLSNTLEKEYEYSLMQWEKVRQLTNSLEGDLCVRLSHLPGTFSGLQCDANRHNGTILVSLSTPIATSKINLPYFVINKRTSLELFNNFSRYFEFMWENSNSIQSDVISDKIE